MKISISRDANCGKIFIPPGDYMVALASDTGQIYLTGGGKQYKLPAVRRRNISRSKVTTVSFFSGGGNQWSLVVSTPKNGEWVSFVEYTNEKKAA